MVNGKRLLFFDILRIVAVTAVVYSHIIMFQGIIPRPEDLLVFNFVYYGIGIVGVYILLFVSGAVLEYSYPNLNTFDDIVNFYFRRLTRIYPAYWISILIGLALSPLILVQYSPFNIFLEFTGFYTWSGRWAPPINPIGWFIGLIVALYFLFPFISLAIKKHPYITLTTVAFVEIFLRIYFNVVHPAAFGMLPDRWFPVCSLMEFGLGIFIIQQGFYPKNFISPGWVAFLGDFSFYVFLAHCYPGFKFIVVSVSLPLYLIEVVLMAGLIMLGDLWVQKKIGASLSRISEITDNTT